MDFRENKHNNAGNGFLFGVVVGGITTLLFTTKKGREIVKEVTERGLDKFSEIQRDLNQAVEFEEIDGDDYIDREERSEVTDKDPKLLASDSKKTDSPAGEESIKKSSSKSPIRRFFKSSKKN
jgi:gas vesicle protein